MGPLRGDGNVLFNVRQIFIIAVEKMGPLRGDGNITNFIYVLLLIVEKMGPLRGDGNEPSTNSPLSSVSVEKMGPLRGDGNQLIYYH